jgi:hypothetical protein
LQADHYRLEYDGPLMQVHIPKPLHGWRAFAGEVGIIVMGVLIALAAQQVAEDWGWRQKVEVVRQSLMGELANDRARWELDLQEAKCAVQESGPLESWARAGGSDSRTPAPALTVTAPSLFTMHTTNWTLAANSQTLDHFPMRQQLAFAALYAGLVNRQRSIGLASDAINRIQTLVPLASDAQGRRELLETIGELKASTQGMIYNEDYMKRHFDAVGVKADASDFAADISKPGCSVERVGAR